MSTVQNDIYYIYTKQANIMEQHILFSISKTNKSTYYRKFLEHSPHHINLPINVLCYISNIMMMMMRRWMKKKKKSAKQANNILYNKIMIFNLSTNQFKTLRYLFIFFFLINFIL